MSEKDLEQLEWGQMYFPVDGSMESLDGGGSFIVEADGREERALQVV